MLRQHRQSDPDHDGAGEPRRQGSGCSSKHAPADERDPDREHDLHHRETDQVGDERARSAPKIDLP